LILLGLVLPTSIAQQAPSGASTEYFKVQLVGISTFYGQERWKTAPIYQTSPPSAPTIPPTAPPQVQDQAARYDGAVGYRVTLKVKLIDEATGQPASDPDLRSVNMTAAIQTSRGPIPAYVARESGTVPGISDSVVFYLAFDVDGSAGPQGGTPIPPLSAGAAYVKVDIVRRSVTGAVRNVGSDTLVFDYELPPQTVTVTGLGDRNYVSEIPDATFRLFTDIGWGSTVPFVTDPVKDDAVIRAEYAFAAPGATVQFYALTAQRCSPSGACLPQTGQGGAMVEILRRTIDTKKTDSKGNVSFSVNAKDLLTYPGRNNAFSAAIVVLAAALTPEADNPADLGPGFSKGGFNLRTGSKEIVLAVGTRPARITGFSVDNRLEENATTRKAPDPIAAMAGFTNTLTVNLYDDAGSVACADCGDAVAIVPGARGSSVLAKARISSPADSPEDSAKYRVAKLAVHTVPPYAGIQESHVTSYRVLGLLYDPQDQFQGLAYADRGYRLSWSAPPTRITEKGSFYLNLTSVNTNYDARANEPGFQLKVVMRVSPQGSETRNETFLLEEGGVSSHQIPIQSSRVGEIMINFQGTTGDTFTGPLTATALFHNKAPKKSLADRIPGPELAGLVVAVAAAVLLVRRREAF
jgi:hypothetical protein